MTHMHLLKQAGIFQDLTPTQYQLLAAISDEEEYEAGAVVLEEGSPGTELYVIARGSVAIQIGARGGVLSAPQTIAQLVAGDSFGEVALVDQGLRSARAICSEPCLLLRFERDRLHTLCLNYPALGYILMRNLAADLAMKIRTTDSQLSQLLAQLRAQS